MMAITLIALVVLMTAATVAAQSKGGGNCPIPGIGPFECPIYTFNTSTYGVEFRDYPVHGVALCPLRAPIPLLEAEAVSICYPDLDGYFNGANADKASISRTAPVSEYWFDGYDGYHYYYTLFYLPVALTTPPAPTSPYVYIGQTSRNLEVATFAFSPNATALDQDIINFAVFELAYRLNQNKVPFHNDAHHISWYEPPFLPPRNLRNEVWSFPITMPNSTFVSPFEHIVKDLPKDMIRTVEPKNKQAMLNKAADKRANLVNKRTRSSRK